MLAPRDDATPCSVEEATGVEDILIANDKAPEEFEPVPFKVVDRAWAVTGRHQWRRPLTLPVAEARASLNAVKHVIRTQANWGMKHLLLSDSMTAVCALSRGRAQGFELRRVCQQFGAIPLVTRCSFSLRWIPSEWNPADGPSRGSWTASQPKQIGPPKLERATPLFSSLEVGGRLSGSGGTEHGDLPEPFAAQFESSQESLEAAGTGGGETKTTHSQSYGRGGKRLHQPDSAQGSSANRTLTAQCPNKTVLEAAAVTPACLRRYQVAWNRVELGSTPGCDAERRSQAHCRSRLQPGEPPGVSLLGRRRSFSCPVPHRGHHLLCARNQGHGHSVTASGQTKPPRVASALPSAESTPCPFRGGGVGLFVGGRVQPGAAGFSPFAQLHALPEAGRGTGIENQRCCPSFADAENHLLGPLCCTRWRLARLRRHRSSTRPSA